MAVQPLNQNQRWEEATQGIKSKEEFCFALTKEYTRVFKTYLERCTDLQRSLKKQSLEVPKIPQPPEWAPFYSKWDTLKDVCLQWVGNSEEKMASDRVRVHRWVVCKYHRLSDFIDESSVIRIQGVAFEALHKFVKYLYTHSVEDCTDEIYSDLYSLAGCFEMKPLQEICKDGYKRYLLQQSRDAINPEEFDEMITSTKGESEVEFKNSIVQKYEKEIKQMNQLVKKIDAVLQDPLCGESS